MNRSYQVWHPTQPESKFPDHYTRVAVVEANDLFDGAKKAHTQIQINDIFIHPAMILYVFEGNGQFGVHPYRLDFERTPALQEMNVPQDRAFAAAVLAVQSPTPEQIEKVVTGQQDAYHAQQEDRAIWQAYDKHYEPSDQEQPPPWDNSRNTEVLPSPSQIASPGLPSLPISRVRRARIR
jgi:hypothetical protein